MNRNHAIGRPHFVLAVLLGFCVSFAQAQFQPSSAIQSAISIPLDRLLQPQQLNEILQKKTHPLPLVLQVGSHMLFSEAHIPGSEFAGPGSQPFGLEMLRNRVASLPKDKFIVIYCGCCPWERCPNLGPAYQQLRDLGFTNVKALYIANNFGADWAAKGYGVEK